MVEQSGFLGDFVATETKVFPMKNPLAFSYGECQYVELTKNQKKPEYDNNELKNLESTV